MSDTTAMIDVTATMLPSTVMNERSFAAQMAESAMPPDSRNWPTLLPNFLIQSPDLLRRLLVVHLDQIAVGHAPDRVVRTGHHLIARLQAVEDFEVFLSRDSHLDRNELRGAVAHDEYT